MRLLSRRGGEPRRTPAEQFRVSLDEWGMVGYLASGRVKAPPEHLVAELAANNGMDYQAAEILAAHWLRERRAKWGRLDDREERDV